jgi:hypothetical protein
MVDNALHPKSATTLLHRSRTHTSRATSLAPCPNSASQAALTGTRILIYRICRGGCSATMPFRLEETTTTLLRLILKSVPSGLAGMWRRLQILPLSRLVGQRKFRQVGRLVYPRRQRRWKFDRSHPFLPRPVSRPPVSPQMHLLNPPQINQRPCRRCDRRIHP